MKNIVTIGGGTGSYTVLSGLKNLRDISLTALVSMADDGGSTGVLRKTWHVMPPGDARQCLAALSGKEFLNHRIKNGFLKEHKVGNIFLGLLEKITGDFSRGLRVLSFLLYIKGKVTPITKDDAVLCVELEDGKVIKGENNIDTANLQAPKGRSLVNKVFYEKPVALNPSAKEAILEADYIIIGPGNIYCSIIPNLITQGFREDIQKSNAKIIYLMNLVNKQGHTMGWNEEKYVNIIEKYLGRKVDVILENNDKFSPVQENRYRDDGGENIFIKNGMVDERIIKANLLADKIFIQEEEDSVKRSLIRHDSLKLAKVVEKIIN